MRPRAIYLLVMMVLSLWLTFILFTGGFVVAIGGQRFSARDPLRPALALLAIVVAYVWRRRDVYAADADALVTLLTRRAWFFVIPIALAACLAGVTFGTFSVGGADTYGYVSQSALWLDGNLIQDEPLLRAAWWPGGGRPLAPLAYTLAPGGKAIVPVYASGLPIFMAISRVAAGECGPFIVVPIFAALAIVATYMLGAAIGSRVLGLVAAMWMASSPAFLFIAMSPMSDIPVMTAWTFAIVLGLGRTTAARAAAGGAAGIAILIRPNLAPVLVLALAGLILLDRARGGARAAWRHAIAFAAGAAPGILLTATVQHFLYGAPWRLGYGNLSPLFGVDNIAPNAIFYVTQIVRTETPLILLSAAALAGWRVRGSLLHERPARRYFGLFVAALWIMYLPYMRVPDWWYLRFLLPMFPVLISAALVPLWLGLRERRAAVALPVAWLGTLALVFVGINAANNRGVFALEGEQRHAAIGDFVKRQLPANAALLSMQHSGSLRYYAKRVTLRYDFIKGPELDRAIATLKAQGLRPYIVIEDWEEPEFRRRFQGFGAAGSLEVGAVGRYPYFEGVTIYDPDAPADQVAVSIPHVPARPCRFPAALAGRARY